MGGLAPIPLDDFTLDAIEHALGAALDENNEVTGADYMLSALLDFLAGASGDDPNEEVLIPGVIPGLDPPRAVLDTRPTYHVNDLIAALVAEIRRLRSTQPEGERP
jgi:hypothetical protein